MTRVPIVIGLTCTLFGTSGNARTWHVKPDGSGEVPTIQAASDSATAGDTILVASGRYTWTSQGGTGEALVRLKADIVLRSEAGAASTVLDAERRGRVIHCIDVGNARIDGFTITGGDLFDGGGICSEGNSEPTVSNCVIRENGGFQIGGGIVCEGARIEHCEILDNVAGGGPGGYGGGIVCFNSVIVGCIIRGNRADGQGAGGGGVKMSNSTMRNCWIEGNWATGASLGSSGGGAAASGSGARDSIVSCTFVGNRAGGASALSATRMSVVDCVFVGNEAYTEAGTIALTDSDMNRCTVIFNAGAGYPTPVGGIWAGGVQGATVRSTIVAFNEGKACAGSGNWICNDLFGNSRGNAICGVDGGGNFVADPEFCAVDPAASLSFLLQADSPCAPGQHPESAACGLIGAAPVGCGAVSLETTTWSRLKALFR